MFYKSNNTRDLNVLNYEILMDEICKCKANRLFMKPFKEKTTLPSMSSVTVDT